MDYRSACLLMRSGRASKMQSPRTAVCRSDISSRQALKTTACLGHAGTASHSASPSALCPSCKTRQRLSYSYSPLHSSALVSIQACSGRMVVGGRWLAAAIRVLEAWSHMVHDQPPESIGGQLIIAFDHETCMHSERHELAGHRKLNSCSDQVRETQALAGTHCSCQSTFVRSNQ